MNHQYFYDENSLPKLTFDELKSFKGFEDLDEFEAEEIINSFIQLAIVVYNLNN